MEKSEQLSPIVQTGQTLLLLQRDLRGIDSKYKPDIEKYAKQAVDALSMNLTESEKSDVLRKIQLGNYETFEILEIDMSSFLREVDDTMRDSVDEAVVRMLDGEDVTPNTFSQNVELLKELSFTSGYLASLTVLFSTYQSRVPSGEFLTYFVNHLRKKVQNSQQKSRKICYELLKKALQKSPDVTDIVLTFNPLLGYETSEGIPDDYSKFCERLDKTSFDWVNVGRYFGERRFKQIQTTRPTYEGIV